jgi:hypothetical protein
MFLAHHATPESSSTYLFNVSMAFEGLAFPFPSAAPFGLSSSALSSLPKGSGSRTQDKLCSPSMGIPLLQHISLTDTGVPLEIQETSPKIPLTSERSYSYSGMEIFGYSIQE